MGADVRVARVKIWNADTPSRLSNSTVSLIDSQGTTQYSYRIGDATGKAVIEFPSFKVRVQLEGTDNIALKEVQVFNRNGVNVALNKPATQSSTPAGYPPASKAVNGDLTDSSVTNWEAGK